jgi:hypothetical protein
MNFCDRQLAFEITRAFTKMRLLNTTTFELHFGDQEYFKSQGYAILSHRWVGAEITFDQIQKHAAELRTVGEKEKQSSSFQLDKIRGACATAHQLGFTWIWIDNCCINKASATEESESINSMFKWYRDAQVCITYLSDVRLGAPSGPPSYEATKAASEGKSLIATHNHEKEVPSMFRSVSSQSPSEWFSRGWTLQELLAPREMRFYDSVWTYMGTKTSLAHEIENVTGIEIQYLIGSRHFRKASIATKMSWQAGRTTARIEDIAYSMLGLFNIMMVPQYGEGQRAFMRLQHQLQSMQPDESLFAWRMPNSSAGDQYDVEASPDTVWASDEWGLLAPTPDWFKSCGNVSIEEDSLNIRRPTEGFQTTQQGTRVQFLPMAGSGKYMAIMMLASLTIVGGLPAFLAVKKHMEKKVMKGVAFPLNCWVRDETGKLAAVSIYLRPVSKESMSQPQPYKMKRIRCAELPLSYEYAREGAEAGQGLVMQPQLQYDD